ncbi:MAG: LCP family protein [Anaerolineae bacterium]|nr:LCP family protein [Anaerolineae bacterium]
MTPVKLENRLLFIGLLLVLIVNQVACIPGPSPTQSQLSTLTPSSTSTATPSSSVLATPAPTGTFPPTWTPTPTFLPTPTFTPDPPTLTPTPSPTLVTPLPPHRPTAVPIVVTVTPHPSSTMTIPAPVPRVYIPEDAITVALLGIDQRPDWNDWHTDAVQYVVIYPHIPSVSVLSIPRDLYIYVPNFWMTRINFADMYGELNHHEGGGFGLFNQALLYNLGITADYYVKVNFDGLIGLVDTLGGVDIPVHCRLEDYWPYPDEQGEYPWFVLEPGIHHLDGEQALWYSRSRKTTSAFSREKRQQQVLEAMWRRGKQIDLLRTAPQLYEQTRGLYQTDMDWNTILSLVVVAMQLEPSNVRMYNIGRQQVEPYVTPYGGNVFIPLWDEISPIIEQVIAAPASSRAFQALVPIEIWNGTPNADWDLLAADWLSHYGYLPSIGEPDRRDYAQTQLVVFSDTSKGLGLPLLQSYFGLGENNIIYQNVPESGIKLRLILGQNHVTCK